MPDRRVFELHKRFAALADAKHAAFHKDYHKSVLNFHGLRTPKLRAAMREVFPKRPRGGAPMTAADTITAARELWAFDWHEERVAALELLTRVAGELPVSSLAWLKRLSRECNGWGLLDALAVNVLGRVALTHGDKVYGVARSWSGDRCMWTRRAAILIHVLPARQKRLAGEYAWPVFEERLHEPKFFIRKAIGWTLRECSKHYPNEVYEFLSRAGNRVSGLTRREGGRNLPDPLRRTLGL